MGKFINPFTDVGFKKIFGQEVSKDLLIDFLNDLLVGERSIKDITFLDKELLPEYMGDRGVIYDIYCTTEAGEHIIVEMQNRQQTNFKERALFYLSHTITRQGEKGARWEFDLKAVYGVFFMNFRLEDTPHKLRTDIVLSDRDTHEVFWTSCGLFLSSFLLSTRRKRNARRILNVGYIYSRIWKR